MPLIAPTFNCCPYTLKPLSTLTDVNNEHIIPDALGGVLDYSFRCDAQRNADLGTTLDAALVESPLIAFSRVLHGIPSRTGRPKARFRGFTVEGEKQVEVDFLEDGALKIHARNPLTLDPSGTSGEIMMVGDNAEKFMKDFIKGNERKGKEVRFRESRTAEDSTIKLDLTLDFLTINRALAKIAYGSLYHYLGDQYLLDPMAEEWRKAIFSNNREEVKRARIRGTAFAADKVLPMIMPDLKPYEHCVSIANFGNRLIVGVTLFGNGFHNSISLASTTTYGLHEGEGRIAICDARRSETRFIDFTEHLVTIANQLFPM